MKTVTGLVMFAVLICACTNVEGHSGPALIPVVVSVTNEDGQPIRNASVRVDHSEIDRLIKNELNKELPFVKMLQEAKKPRRTNSFGEAVIRVGGRFTYEVKADTEEYTYYPRGKLLVSAKGYQSLDYEIPERLREEPSVDRHRRVILISITLTSENTNAPNKAEDNRGSR